METNLITWCGIKGFLSACLPSTQFPIHLPNGGHFSGTPIESLLVCTVFIQTELNNKSVSHLSKDAQIFVNGRSVISQNKCPTYLFIYFFPFRKTLTYPGKDAFPWFCFSVWHSCCQSWIAFSPFLVIREMALCLSSIPKSTMPPLLQGFTQLCFFAVIRDSK